MSHVESLVLCREAQVSTLQSLFGERHHFSFPSIFIYGHTASGKTYVTQTLLKALEPQSDDVIYTGQEDPGAQGGGEQQLPHAFVNCVECFTLKLLLEQILNKLSHLNSSKAECPTEITCETFNDFVRLFKQVTSTENLKDQTVYITDRNVTVIFLSEIIWEKFRPNTGCFEPFVLYFPDYSIGQEVGALATISHLLAVERPQSDHLISVSSGNLQKILSHDHPPEYSADFYAAYINILLGVFYTVCRDLKELRHLAVLNFPKYCEPVVKGEGN
ncbi:hypothetical protein U0070_022881 [Myodes glareolus]|uniref:Origin recognition complex subunit 5 n=1 Tax=Myodes glareolus TaxID=447135 RepID=A0AAW0K889_MYOGA